MLRPLMHVLVVMAFIAAAGCDSNGGQRQTEPAVGEIPASLDLRTFSLPMDSYERSDRQHSLTAKAMAVTSTKCMARFGFDVAPPPMPAGTAVGHLHRYGLVLKEDAERYGYRPPPERNTAKAKEPQLSKEAFAVMHGQVERSGSQTVPKGGCLGEARRRLAMRDDSDEALVYRLGGEVSEQAETDSRVQAAFAAWSRCMSAAGFQYRDPWQANNDAQWKQGAAASAGEIAAAVADVHCKRQERVIEVWATVEAAYQRRAIEQNAAALHEARQALEAETRNVTDVLAETR